ncbi:hypothetical protein KM043_003203 [Ampulex compressa]|nr:hypothetical protein KM043_003203 [Ampulex compressa]
MGARWKIRWSRKGIERLSAWLLLGKTQQAETPSSSIDCGDCKVSEERRRPEPRSLSYYDSPASLEAYKIELAEHRGRALVGPRWPLGCSARTPGIFDPEARPGSKGPFVPSESPRGRWRGVPKGVPRSRRVPRSRSVLASSSEEERKSVLEAFEGTRTRTWSEDTVAWHRGTSLSRVSPGVASPRGSEDLPGFPGARGDPVGRRLSL